MFKKSVILVCSLVFLLCLCGLAAAQGSKNVFIKRVYELGSKIEMMDGSTYSVPNPDDQEIAYEWLPSQKVLIKPDGTIINLIDGSRIDGVMETPSASSKVKPAPASGPMYSKSAAGKGYSAPAAAQAVPPGVLNKILKRLDDLDSKLQVMDWRLRQIEGKAMIQPMPADKGKKNK